MDYGRVVKEGFGVRGDVTEETLYMAETGNASTPDEDRNDEWIATGCYLCYGQCSNFGVEGKAVGDSDGTRRVRPCSKGLSEIMRRRRMRDNRPRLTALPSTTP